MAHTAAHNEGTEAGEPAALAKPATAPVSPGGLALADGEAFTWSAHPARRRPVQAVVVALVILLFSTAAALFGGSAAWGALSAGVLILTLSRFFFPSTYVLDETGITAECLVGRQQMRWQDVRRFVHDRHGGYLSTRSRRSWLDGIQGMHLVTGRDHDEIVARIEQYRASAAEAEGAA